MQHADFSQISRRFQADFHAEWDDESLPNPCGIYLCLIHASRIDFMQHAYFTKNSMQNALRNLCEIHADSIYALRMLDSMPHADFTQISRSFHADFHAKCDAEFFRNPCGSIYALCILDSMQHASFTQISRRLEKNAMRNLCGIHAESLWNPCVIHADYTYALCMLDSIKHAVCTQFSHRFHANVNAECNAESFRNLCGINLCLMQAWFYAACRFHAGFHAKCDAESLRNPCSIFAESMPNLAMPYPCLIPYSLQISRKLDADLRQTSTSV